MNRGRDGNGGAMRRERAARGAQRVMGEGLGAVLGAAHCVCRAEGTGDGRAGFLPSNVLLSARLRPQLVKLTQMATATGAKLNHRSTNQPTARHSAAMVSKKATTKQSYICPCNNAQIRDNLAYSASCWSVGEHKFGSTGHQARFCRRNFCRPSTRSVRL